MTGVMMDLVNEFIHWYFNEFRFTDMYINMQYIREESPHHLEESIGTHNDMVVSQCLSRIVKTSSRSNLAAVPVLFAAAFHDVGKPDAMEWCYKEERGHYKKFQGHELLSARMWENWAVENWLMLKERFCMCSHDIFRVAWMIENHLPWSVKNIEKRRRLAYTCNDLLCNADYFIDLLLADASGRLTEGNKLDASVEWCNEFREFAKKEGRVSREYGDNILYMPIGPSGVGKSTFYNNLRVHTTKYSWDDLRLEWYIEGDEHDLPIKDQYRIAFTKSIEDDEFGAKANATFIDLLRKGKNVFVDNINLSKKRRRFFVEEARRKGYKIVALLFPITLDEVINRQTTREDKFVNGDIVKRQYMSLQMPSYGEFHDVYVLNGNLPK